MNEVYRCVDILYFVMIISLLRQLKVRVDDEKKLSRIFSFLEISPLLLHLHEMCVDALQTDEMVKREKMKHR